ncbi:MAG: site-specific integrase [Clostridium celatum]|uniref:site-specific tyrosine recombinase/integron integrase n=1 Tax=Clostridium TaxID=1485 RepID=UPI00232C2AE2|nr:MULTISPECIES: site-specific tyrosine recombinase/integron integrase [Clostridium]MDB7267150.1 site-specific integrase [Enterococcus faecium]MDU2124159.1 site-specific integrase [Clostridium celatum]MBS4958995.1 site-specific integrase [Clostridium sp.]MDB1924509.1 site-specific integrase [Clostridium tertium]MDB1928030.1 site-specific integrase [Clostridium tertium]
MYQKIDKMVKDLELRGRSASTIKNMVYTLKSFSNFYNQAPELLGEQQIINYLDYCINEKKLCKARVNSINSILKFFYVVTLERQWNDLRIPRIRCHRNLPAYLTKEEVKLIIDNATYLKHKAILSTIYSAGLRVSEATNLRLSDIMSKEMKIRVRAGKGNKERYTLLSQRNLELLREYWKIFGHKNYDSEDYLFTSRWSGGHLTNRGIQSFMLAATKRAGITKKATPHTLRHSFATHLMNDGVDLVIIQALLGHSNLKTTSIYLHVKDYTVLNVVSPFDKL